MGTSQIDFGILLDDEEYCVSPAYSTYNIVGINPTYFRDYLILLNPVLSYRYMITGARQGKSVNKEELIKFEFSVCSKEEQLYIQKIMNSLSKKLELEKETLAYLLKQKQYLLRQMFI